MLVLVGKGEWSLSGLPFLVKARTRLKVCLVWFGKGSQLLQGKGLGLRGDTGMGFLHHREGSRH